MKKIESKKNQKTMHPADIICSFSVFLKCKTEIIIMFTLIVKLKI